MESHNILIAGAVVLTAALVIVVVAVSVMYILRKRFVLFFISTIAYQVGYLNLLINMTWHRHHLQYDVTCRCHLTYSHAYVPIFVFPLLRSKRVSYLVLVSHLLILLLFRIIKCN